MREKVESNNLLGIAKLIFLGQIMILIKKKPQVYPPKDTFRKAQR
jgi:hypothetical protein